MDQLSRNPILLTVQYCTLLRGARAEVFVDPPVTVEELPRGSRWSVTQLLGTLLQSLDKSCRLNWSMQPYLID
jgi:hypothetical protein